MTAGSRDVARIRHDGIKTMRMKIWELLWLALALFNGAQCAVASEKVTIYLTDAQGSVVAETDAQGNVNYTAANRPYGAQAMGAPQAGPGYTGHVNDPDTGLVYMQARYYDPTIGRFLSPDPVSPEPGNSFNFGRYTYANGNPVRYTDPDGRCVDGLTCGTMFQAHTEWRLSHPNAPADWLEKAAMMGVTAMASVSGAEETRVAVTAIRTIVRFSKIKIAQPKVTTTENSVNKARNKPPAPLAEAEGRPHSIIEKPGKGGQYTTHNSDGTWKQYRGSGQDHGGIPRPNVKEAGKNITPDGRVFIDKGRVRPPRPDEIP